MKKVMLIGQSGQLARCIIDVWREDKGDLILIPVSKVGCDVACVSQVQEAISVIEPDFIINTAAYHDLKQCEDNPGMASRVNVNGPRILSEYKPRHCKLIHISTDYVFDGEKGAPYTEKDDTGPVNLYGLTKLEGERFADLVIRTSSLFSQYGSTGKRNSNFVLWLTKAGWKQPDLALDKHITMSPTYAPDLAAAILDCVRGFDGLPRFLHLTNSGPSVSWFEFGTEVLSTWGIEREPKVRSPEEGGNIRRPEFSALDDALSIQHGFDMPTWMYALERMRAATLQGIVAQLKEGTHANQDQ